MIEQTNWRAVAEQAAARLTPDEFAAIVAQHTITWGPVPVRLRYPIALGDEAITVMTIRPPTGKDFRRLQCEDGYELDTMLRLASRLSGQPDAVIDHLAGEDLENVLRVVKDFWVGRAPGAR